MAICLLTGNGSEIFITLVGCLYPGYMSVKAVLSKDTEDDQRWLKYWVLLAALLVVSLVGDCLLCWLPGYCLAKAGLLIWCQAPREDNGSVVLFNSVVTFSPGQSLPPLSHSWSGPYMRSTALKSTR